LRIKYNINETVYAVNNFSTNNFLHGIIFFFEGCI